MDRKKLNNLIIVSLVIAFINLILKLATTIMDVSPITFINYLLANNGDFSQEPIYYLAVFALVLSFIQIVLYIIIAVQARKYKEIRYTPYIMLILGLFFIIFDIVGLFMFRSMLEKIEQEENKPTDQFGQPINFKESFEFDTPVINEKEDLSKYNKMLKQTNNAIILQFASYLFSFIIAFLAVGIFFVGVDQVFPIILDNSNVVTIAFSILAVISFPVLITFVIYYVIAIINATKFQDYPLPMILLIIGIFTPFIGIIGLFILRTTIKQKLISK